MEYIPISFSGIFTTRLRQFANSFDPNKMGSLGVSIWKKCQQWFVISKLLVIFLLKWNRFKQPCALYQCWDTMKLIITHNENITVLSQLSRHLELEDERRGYRLILLLIRLSLVNMGHLGPNSSNMTKYVVLGNLSLK